MQAHALDPPCSPYESSAIRGGWRQEFVVEVPFCGCRGLGSKRAHRLGRGVQVSHSPPTWATCPYTRLRVAAQRALRSLSVATAVLHVNGLPKRVGIPWRQTCLARDVGELVLCHASVFRNPFIVERNCGISENLKKACAPVRMPTRGEQSDKKAKRGCSLARARPARVLERACVEQTFVHRVPREQSNCLAAFRSGAQCSSLKRTLLLKSPWIGREELFVYTGSFWCSHASVRDELVRTHL